MTFFLNEAMQFISFIGRRVQSVVDDLWRWDGPNDDTPMSMVVMPKTTRTIIGTIHHDRVGLAGTKTTTTTTTTPTTMTTGKRKHEQSKYYYIHAAGLVIIIVCIVIFSPRILLSTTLVSIHYSTVLIMDSTDRSLFRRGIIKDC